MSSSLGDIGGLATDRFTYKDLKRCPWLESGFRCKSFGFSESYGHPELMVCLTGRPKAKVGGLAGVYG